MYHHYLSDYLTIFDIRLLTWGTLVKTWLHSECDYISKLVMLSIFYEENYYSRFSCCLKMLRLTCKYSTNIHFKSLTESTIALQKSRLIMFITVPSCCTSLYPMLSNYETLDTRHLILEALDHYLNGIELWLTTDWNEKNGINFL